MAQTPLQVKLVPYTINSIVDKTNETPKGVSLIQASEIWEESNQGEGIVVAVIDTGVDTDHPDLKDQIIGKKFYN